MLVRIDARAAEQTASASDAQVRSAQALLDVASKDFERQKQLFEKHYISQAALERAESQFKATQAQAAAQLAQAGAARTQSGFYVVRAPYAGVVAEVPVALGDMAMPGRPLLTLYDPAALRVTAAVPQSALARAADRACASSSRACPSAQRWLAPRACRCCPRSMPATHTVQLRMPCRPAWPGVAPGMFARVWLPAARPAAQARLFVPARRSCAAPRLTGVYVLDAKGAPLLRQVRLGRAGGRQVEVLSRRVAPASASRSIRRPRRACTETRS